MVRLQEREVGAGKCVTYRQVAEDVPLAFRPLWQASIPDEAALRSGFPCESISLRRSAGHSWFQPGASYTVTLFRDGSAELKSKDAPDTESEYAGNVASWDYGKLCYLTERLGLDRFAQYYSANWTDANGTRIAVTSRARQFVVSEYSGIGPIELWAIENAIEAVKKRIEWKVKQ